MTHQARGYDRFNQPVSYVDMCAPCFAMKQVEKQAEDAKRREEAEAPYNYFQSGMARADLLASKESLVNIYQLGRIWEPKKGLLGESGEYRKDETRRHGRFVDTVTLFGHGWILGELLWKFIVIRYRDLEEAVENYSLTALMNDDSHATLARLQPYAEDYQVLNHTFLTENDVGNTLWGEAMQAVKRLTGKSN